MNINAISFKIILYSAIALAKGDSTSQPVVEYYNFDYDQYVFFSQRLTWDEASMICAAHNGKLAVLDTLEKAADVAQAMADSNIVTGDAWIGGRRIGTTWLWVGNANFTSSGSVIPSEPDIENFPPWAREPTRNKKECLALDRFEHSNSSFIDLDCRLPKPFICQKRSQDSLNSPVPSKRVSVDKKVYILYHGQLTWTEAVTFCRLHGTRLAVIKNQNTLNIITTNMIKSRPDFESVWIGAHYSYGQWTWLSTGFAISPVRDESGYPPWKSGKPERNSGCLLLDRHLDRNADFIEVPCDRKRDFICEEYPPEEIEEWESQPVKFTYQNETFAIYPTEKTWDESRLYCQKIGGFLGYVDSFELARDLVIEMGDHPKEISHLWLGGIYNANMREWNWIHNDGVFFTDYNTDYPWAETLMETDLSSEESLCLNLDKADHSKPHIYGLDCESKQPFVCTTDCKNPPTVANGEWECSENSDFQMCTLECANNYHLMGLNTATCSIDMGWYNYNEELNPPLCLSISDYVQRVVRALNQDIFKSSGYYILLAHSDKTIHTHSFEFAEKLLNIFPNHLKMGMSTYYTYPSKIPYEQNDTCTALKLIDIIKTGNYLDELEPKRFSDLLKEIIKNKKEKSVIVAILDSYIAAQFKGEFEQLKLQGHSVIVIGLKEDQKNLSFATIGFEQRPNVYLFDEQEYILFVDEFDKLKNKSLKKCAENKSADNTAKAIENKSGELKENVSDEKAEKVSEEKLNGSKEKTENVSEEKTEKVSEAKMENVSEEKTEKVSEAKMENVPEEKTEKVSEEKVEKVSEEKTENLSKEKTEKVSEEKTENLSKEKTEKVSEEKTETAPAVSLIESNVDGNNDSWQGSKV